QLEPAPRAEPFAEKRRASAALRAVPEGQGCCSKRDAPLLGVVGARLKLADQLGRLRLGQPFGVGLRDALLCNQLLDVRALLLAHWFVPVGVAYPFAHVRGSDSPLPQNVQGRREKR